MAQPAQASPSFHRMHVKPALERLSFSFDCPTDWTPVDLPNEDIDFSNPLTFMPLGVCMLPSAAIVFSVAARPAYDDGSVIEWAKYLCEQQGFQITQLLPGEVNGVPAIRASATQATDAGTMQMMLAFFEDNNGLISISAMAPLPLFGAMEKTFERMIGYFALKQPQGAKRPLVPGQPPPQSRNTFAALALSDHPATLADPEHKLNAYFRDNGIGLLPRLLSVNEAERFGTLGCGAILAPVNVPFGWHIIDDGKRTLVMDPDNKIQVNLTLIQAQAAAIDAVMDQIIAEYAPQQPNAAHHKLEIEGLPVLAFKGLVIGDEQLNQIFIFRPHDGMKDMLLKARVTASEADTYRAMDLAGMIVQTMQFPHA